MDDQKFLSYCLSFGKKTGVHRLKKSDISRLYAMAGFYDFAMILYETKYKPKPNGENIFVLVNLALKYQKDNLK